MSWEMVKLGDVCELKYGKSLPKQNRIKGNVNVYGSNGIVGSHSEALIKAPVVVIGRKGSIGKIQYQKTGSIWPIDTTYYIDETKTEISFDWLYYLFSTLNLENMNKAAAVPGLNRNDVYNIQIPLPPLPEQQRIAALLEQVDHLRHLRQRALQRLDDLVQSTFLELFGDPVTNPKGWEVKAFKDIIEGFETGKSVKPVDQESTKNRVLKISAVTWKDFAPEQSKPISDEFEPNPSYFVKKEDLLFSRANTSELVGATCYVFDTPNNLILPDKLWRFIWKTPSPINPFYCWYVLLNPRVRDIIGGLSSGSSGSMKNISQKKFLEVQIPVPDLSLQNEFEKFVRLQRINSLKTKTSLNKLDTLFNALMQQAFTGQLQWTSAEDAVAQAHEQLKLPLEV